MTCQAKAGFLLLRKCKNQEEESCQFCGKLLCREHALPVQAGGFACSECLQQHEPQQQNYTRTHHDDYYGTHYTPYYGNDFSDTDRNACRHDRAADDATASGSYDS